MCLYFGLFVLGVVFEIEGFWGGVVFELLGVGEDFVSRWGLVLGVCLICFDRRVLVFCVGVIIFLFVLCYGMFVEIEVFWGG